MFINSLISFSVGHFKSDLSWCWFITYLSLIRSNLVYFSIHLSLYSIYLLVYALLIILCFVLIIYIIIIIILFISLVNLAKKVRRQGREEWQGTEGHSLHVYLIHQCNCDVGQRVNVSYKQLHASIIHPSCNTVSL